jgi:hypothetical protein
MAQQEQRVWMAQQVIQAQQALLVLMAPPAQQVP